MGLLGSILTVGGAVAGSFVGQPGLGASIGGAIGGAVEGGKGAKKATKAQLAAIAEARKIQGEAKNEAVGYQQPYLGFGQQSVNALSGRLGLPQGAPATMPGNALTMGGSPLATSSPFPAGVGPDDGPVNYAAMGGGDTFVDPRTGQAPDVSRAAAAPTNDPSTAINSPAVPGAPPQSQPQPGTTMNALTGGPTVDPGTYGTTANPTYTAPDAPEAFEGPEAFSYGLDDYKASPAFEGRLRRMIDGVQSSAAAQGSLFSGATLKELSDRASALYLDDFQGERAFAEGRYDKNRQFDYGLSRDARSDFQDDRGFGRQVYGDDRNYLTGRFDQQTNNLFRGIGVGQGAAGVASNAATRYGDQVAGLATDAGNARAQNALTQGQIGSDLATGLGGVLSGALGGGFGGSAPASRNALTLGDAWGFQPLPGNLNLLRTPANIRI